MWTPKSHVSGVRALEDMLTAIAAPPALALRTPSLE
eukprot:SAG25_NODE_2329_length_1715_cov_1.167698_3_plen_35_part_01